ncbi:transcriptional regulator, Crp/Fnr family [Cellulomonas flavigena DSM 20109]|uniref:Transcriptional regulator, Crp/Fnr family n=1 Tax=Cellulomonas flavigena (strain ATCC 482 / DSM 20109 / BCRC 11376 / JCM 18109 / NBRC 3775 / NCIMB 8073 / NRS 134) TaxID=446466 RepID=D5UJA8_CELFN|nr:Crp/Fnr family transcriptional regulator [Cellulomonas flavigena]ADG73631.1 transcriptional regulator, Crp/Fnr family [Cellulomonas flavigena DSM 20109]
MTTHPPDPSARGRRRVPLATGCGEPHDCPRPVRLRVLARTGYFAGLDDAALADVDRRLVSLAWAQGDTLFRAGEPAEHLFVLAAGRVKVVHPTERGTDVITDVLVPGDLFGTLSTLGDRTYPETAQALTTVCALRLDVGTFRTVLAEHPTVALRVLDDVAARLQAARTGAARTVSGTVEQRVAGVLLRLADRLGQEQRDGATLLQLPLTRADLAAMTGSTPESVSRVMSRLRQEGAITTGRRWTAVVDARRLAQLAG